MIRTILAAVASCCAACAGAPALAGEPGAGPADAVWSFSLTDIDGRPYPLADLRGQVLLIVNVASKCGFTPQYAALQRLHERIRPLGGTVVGVPSNDFGMISGQEPGDEAEIKRFCTTTYGVTFPMMAKTRVVGPAAHPLFRHLTQSGPDRGPVTWNFNKFLVDRRGMAIRRFGSRIRPDDPDLLSAIDAALAQAVPAAAP